MEDQLILVDEQDRETGVCGKLEAHEKGLLHRAFSIFIFRRILADNPDGTRTFHNQLMMQKRAAGKYHSAGLWANSCCSHPRMGETVETAAERRLPEETGLSAELEETGAFVYKADFSNGLTEHEFDHVLVGWVDETQTPYPNPEEAEEMVFADVENVMKDVLQNPGRYAAWFMPALLIATDGQEFESLNREASDRILY